MSKSDLDTRSRIDLSDTPDEIRSKIRRALSDTTSEMWYDPVTRPAISNLLRLHSLVREQSIEQSVTDARGMDTLAFKRHLADATVERLRPIHDAIRRLDDEHAYVDDVYRRGAERAREIAAQTLSDVRRLVGFDVGSVTGVANSVQLSE